MVIGILLRPAAWYNLVKQWAALVCIEINDCISICQFLVIIFGVDFIPKVLGAALVATV